jgi:hypothetical protein
VARIQAIYYREERGVERVDEKLPIGIECEVPDEDPEREGPIGRP